MKGMPLGPPNLHPDLPIYPPHLQLIRVTATTIAGPSSIAQTAGSSILAGIYHVAFTQQRRTDSGLPRDREPCIAHDVNQTGLRAGFHLGRLAGSHNSLPVYEIVALGPSGSIVGIPGPQGPMGLTGATGATGSTGNPGTQGSKGDKGDTGATGATGSTGNPGTQGTSGATGSTGPQGPEGSSGVVIGTVGNFPQFLKWNISVVNIGGTKKFRVTDRQSGAVSDFNCSSGTSQTITIATLAPGTVVVGAKSMVPTAYAGVATTAGDLGYNNGDGSPTSATNAYTTTPGGTALQTLNLRPAVSGLGSTTSYASASALSPNQRSPFTLTASFTGASALTNLTGGSWDVWFMLVLAV